ncbi:hypothetical protein M1O19_00735 [Dehalococcoidia bacterium]|nr:hypothetical protein [Dehalococcoidia bacterium]MCL0097052.1 hypothetical protein [Dehalococcoidia bacterium]
MKEKIVCGVLIGEARSEEEAERKAQRFKDCPYVVFIGTFADKYVEVCFIPEGHPWWLEAIRGEPEAMGFRNTTVLITDEVKVTYPKGFKLRLPEEKLEVAPCGLVCKECSLFERCSGCPATIYYKGGDYAV